MYCQEHNDPVLQNINWDAINHALEQPYSSNPAMWLETHQWWTQANAQSFSGTALWLLPDVESWENIDTFYSELFTLIISFYQSGFFHRINAAELLKLLDANTDFTSLLTHLLTKNEYPYLIRFILLHLQQLSNLYSYSQQNLLVFLNAASTLNHLIQNQKQLNVSDQFITGLINWLLTNTDTQSTNPVMDFIYNMVLNQPSAINTLNSLSLAQLAFFFDHLVANPAHLTMPSEDETSVITQQAVFIQFCIEQVQQPGHAQVSLLADAIDDLEIAEPAPQPAPQLVSMLTEAINDVETADQPQPPPSEGGDIIQSFIMEPLPGTQPAAGISTGIDEWELLY